MFLTATGTNFDTEVLQHPLPVVVLFGAAGNVPSNLIALKLEKAVDPTKAKVVRVDLDATPDLGMRFSVRDLPFLLVFKSGMAIFQSTEFTPELLKALE